MLQERGRGLYFGGGEAKKREMEEEDEKDSDWLLMRTSCHFLTLCSLCSSGPEFSVLIVRPPRLRPIMVVSSNRGGAVAKGRV